MKHERVERMALLVAVGGLLAGPFVSVSVRARPRAERKLLVCYTVSNVRPRQARKAVQKMVRVIGRLAGFEPESWASEFVVSQAGCVKGLEGGGFQLAFPTLGAYLRLADKLKLRPIAVPVISQNTTDVYRILVKKDNPAGLDGLKGETLGGTVIDDPEFLTRVVFAGRIDAEKHFRLKPSKRALKAIRDVVRGRLGAVMVNRQQYQALEKLRVYGDLAVAYQSRPIPMMGVVSVGDGLTPDENQAMLKALKKFCGDEEGKEFCALFGIERFEEASPRQYKDARKLWGR